MTKPNCYLCGSDNYKIIFIGSNSEIELSEKHLSARKGSINKEFSYNWVQCKKCNLVYANPIPDEKILEKLYTVSDQSDYTNEIRNLALTYKKYLYCYTHDILKKETAVDIGAGNGFFVKELLNFGFKNVKGIEPSTTAYDRAPDDIRPFLLNKIYNENDFASNTIDFISCFQTLEHIHYPNKLIESYYRILSKDGIVFSVAHNFGSLGVKILRSKHPIVNAGHLTLFDMNTLSKMFSKYFRVLHVFKIHNTYSLRYWVSLLPIYDSIKTILLKTFMSVGMDKLTLTMSLGNIGIIARKL